MTPLIILGAFSVVLGTLSGFFAIKQKHLERLLAKMLGSFCFIALGIVAFGKSNNTSIYNLLILGALVLGMIGDIFLVLKNLCLPKYKILMDGIGILSFFLGHILFIIIFLTEAPFTYATIPLAFIEVVFLIILSKIKFVDTGKLYPGFIAYSVVLGTMLMSSVSFFIATGGTKGTIVLIAGILFALSDSSLVIRSFSKFKYPKVLVYVVLVTYYVAQCLFALSICL